MLEPSFAEAPSLGSGAFTVALTAALTLAVTQWLKFVIPIRLIDSLEIRAFAVEMLSVLIGVGLAYILGSGVAFLIFGWLAALFAQLIYLIGASAIDKRLPGFRLNVLSVDRPYV